MGGGPSGRQKDAANRNADIAKQQQQNAQQSYQKQMGIMDNTIMPYAQNRLQNGLPFYNAMTDYTSGQNAAAFAPAKANLERNLANFGALPSGFATQARSDFDANRARAFDSGLMQNAMAQDQAKQQGLGLMVGQQQLLNPQGWSSMASQTNNGIMQAPLASPGIGGMLGGLAGGAMGALGF